MPVEGAIPVENISIKEMFLNADPVVQAVMILLFLASMVSWAIIFEKTVILRRTSRSIWQFKKTISSIKDLSQLPDLHDFVSSIVSAGIAESRDSAGNESRSDFRERVERSMRGVLSGRLDKISDRVMFLATVGASSPFIGLFGTVWGIMHSFIGIAGSGETSLAVVAPGISEALCATALGLLAAIPAVISYNKITGTLKKITKEALAGISILGNMIAKDHFSNSESGGGS